MRLLPRKEVKVSTVSHPCTIRENTKRQGSKAQDSEKKGRS